MSISSRLIRIAAILTLETSQFMDQMILILLNTRVTLFPSGQILGLGQRITPPAIALVKPLIWMQ